jgi:hypothetical protein
MPMKNFLILILMSITAAVLGQESFNYQKDFKPILTKTKDAKDELYYNRLLNRFEHDDTTMTNYEVLALLIGFTDKHEYKPYADLSTERNIYSLNGEKKYKEALDEVNTFLKTHPVSLKAIFEKAYSFYKLNQIDSSNFYSYQGRQIINAMAFSGDGITPETPMFALGPADGQDYIHRVLRGDIGTMGDGRDKNGNFLDILEAKTPDGKDVTYYFIIQHAAAKMF